MDPSACESLALHVVYLTNMAVHAMALFGSFSLPMFIFFLVQRRHQINHPRLELSPTLPAQIAVAILFSAVYGIIAPIGYQLLVRSHDSLFMWGFAPDGNPRWLILAQPAVMIWLGARLIQATLNGDVPRFGGWPDRLMSCAGIFLTAWVFGRIYPHFLAEFRENFYMPTLGQVQYIIQLFFPMTCLAGAMLIFALALMETARVPSRPPCKRAILSWSLAAAFVTIAFSPFILSAPRVPEAQTLALVEANRDDIETAAEAAEIDPRLLAGIIYAAQTRDEPRFTGELVRRFCAACLGQGHIDYLPNPRFGLCPMRDAHAAWVLRLIEYHHGLIDAVPARRRDAEQKANPDWFNAKVEIYLDDDQYYKRMPMEFLDALVDEMRDCYQIQHEIRSYNQQRETSYRRFLKQQANIRNEILDLANYAPEMLYFKMCLPSPRHTTYFDYNTERPAPSYDLRRDKDYNFYYPVMRHWVNHNALARRLEGRLNLLVAAAEINMFDRAWRRAGIPITNQPEILATLFYLDEEILPHALPQPNDFGRRVAAFMNSPECARMFPAPIMVSCAREDER